MRNATKTTRITINAMFIAMYVILELFVSIKLGNMKITFDALPILISAILFGPLSGFVVGILGSFISQMLSFGITLTTILWIIPVGIRGLLVGLYAKKVNYKVEPKKLMGVIIASSILITILNTGSLYIDSKLYGYYAFEFVFGTFILRIITGVTIGIVHGSIVPICASALNRCINYQNKFRVIQYKNR